MPLVAAKNEDGSPLFEAGAPATASFSERPTFLDTLEDLREELEREDDAGGFAERTAQLLTAALAFVKAQPVIVGGAVVLMSLLLVAIVGGPHAFGESDQGTAFVSSSAESPAVTAPVVPTSIVTSSEANPPAPGGAGPSVKAVPTRPRVVEERPVPSKKTPEKKAETKFAIPTLSTAALSRLDSAASKAGSVSTRVGDPVLTAPPNPLTTGRSTFGDNDQSGAPVRARLIGDLPTPRVPNQVTDVEGEVRVRFNVDTNGRPVMATFVVVNSPNPLLTEAVRKVIPGMRFEPARTGGPDSKPIVDVMQIGFQFSRQE
jgi:TonB family protein